MSGSLHRLPPDLSSVRFSQCVRELSRTATACNIPRGYQVAACVASGRMLVLVHLLTLPRQLWAGISISSGMLMPTYSPQLLACLASSPKPPLDFLAPVRPGPVLIGLLSFSLSYCKSGSLSDSTDPPSAEPRTNPLHTPKRSLAKL
jgi:hypothetical protein